MGARILNCSMLIIFFLLFIFLEIPSDIFAQTLPSTDSLKFELTKAKNALDSASIYNEIVWNNNLLDTNLAYQCAMKSLHLAGRIKEKDAAILTSLVNIRAI